MTGIASAGKACREAIWQPAGDAAAGRHALVAGYARSRSASTGAESIPDTRVFASLEPRSGMTPSRRRRRAVGAWLMPGPPWGGDAGQPPCHSGTAAERSGGGRIRNPFRDIDRADQVAPGPARDPPSSGKRIPDTRVFASLQPLCDAGRLQRRWREVFEASRPCCRPATGSPFPPACHSSSRFGANCGPDRRLFRLRGGRRGPEPCSSPH